MQSSLQQKMFRRIDRWKKSGLSKKLWCEKNEMAYATFQYWYKHYRQHLDLSAKDAGSDFIKVTVDDPAMGTPWCELLFANGKKLVLQQPVSADFLRLILD
jgi:hypothetical protein